MSITYRQGYQLGLNQVVSSERDFARPNDTYARKVNPLNKLFKDVSTAYSQKLAEYDSLHSALTTAEDVLLHDSYLSTDSDKNIVRLSELRDQLIALNAQLEVLRKV